MGSVDGTCAGNSAAAGPAEHEQRLPMLISSTEMGAYIKWALLLQEQLSKASEHNRQLTEAIQRLTEENRQLQHAVETGEPVGASMPQAAPDRERGIPLTSSRAADDRSSSSSLMATSTTTVGGGPSTAGGSATSSPKPSAAGPAISQAQMRKEDELLDSLLKTPSMDNGLLSTPNLASLTADLERREASGRGAGVAWSAASRASSSSEAAAGWVGRAPV